MLARAAQHQNVLRANGALLVQESASGLQQVILYHRLMKTVRRPLARVVLLGRISRLVFIRIGSISARQELTVVRQVP